MNISAFDVDAGIIAPLLFGAVQVVCLVFLIMIRYHFRLFALPSDRRGRLIVDAFTAGTVLMFALSFLFLLYFL